MADPDKQTTLAEAITLVGTCQEMCAEFERVDRLRQNDVWPQEKDPITKQADESRFVKKFKRSAADGGVGGVQIPSDLRPPLILKV